MLNKFNRLFLSLLSLMLASCAMTQTATFTDLKATRSFVPPRYSDTSIANAGGAAKANSLIGTYSGGTKVWVRNNSNTTWIQINGGTGGTAKFGVSGEDEIATEDRVFNLDGHSFYFGDYNTSTTAGGLVRGIQFDNELTNTNIFLRQAGPDLSIGGYHAAGLKLDSVRGGYTDATLYGDSVYFKSALDGSQLYPNLTGSLTDYDLLVYNKNSGALVRASTSLIAGGGGGITSVLLDGNPSSITNQMTIWAGSNVTLEDYGSGEIGINFNPPAIPGIDGILAIDNLLTTSRSIVTANDNDFRVNAPSSAGTDKKGFYRFGTATMNLATSLNDSNFAAAQFDNDGYIQFNSWSQTNDRKMGFNMWPLAQSISLICSNYSNTNITTLKLTPSKLFLMDQVDATAERVRLNVGYTISYTDNAAAMAAGLVVGDVYRSGDILKVVHE